MIWGDQIYIEPHAASAVEVGLDDLPVLRPACDLQAARMHPIERLTGFFRECFNLAARILDEADHQVTLAGATHHACSAG